MKIPWPPARALHTFPRILPPVPSHILSAVPCAPSPRLPGGIWVTSRPTAGRRRRRLLFPRCHRARRRPVTAGACRDQAPVLWCPDPPPSLSLWGPGRRALHVSRLVTSRDWLLACRMIESDLHTYIWSRIFPLNAGLEPLSSRMPWWSSPVNIASALNSSIIFGSGSKISSDPWRIYVRSHAENRISKRISLIY